MHQNHNCIVFVAVSLFCLWTARIADSYVLNLTNDGPVILGGTITFKADLYNDDGTRPAATFEYTFLDNSIYQHVYKTGPTTNTTSYYTLTYPPGKYSIGKYEMQVTVCKEWFFKLNCEDLTGVTTSFKVTSLLNGNLSVAQLNKTVKNDYVSSASEAKVAVKLRPGDNEFITKNATSISTYWFIDCKYYGQTDGFSLSYNFTTPGITHSIESLVIASFESTTTTMPTTTNSITVTPTPISNNSVTPALNITTNAVTQTTPLPTTATTLMKTPTATSLSPNSTNFGNLTFPYVCLNSSIIPPDPKKIYGYFHRKVNVRAPIVNIAVEGTNWIQPWDMLSLNVTCDGSGPFFKCLEFHRGIYNATGNETCSGTEIQLPSCNFSIIHYFLEPSVYTIIVIINNDISSVVKQLTINIYKATTKPQLSVIVVPVSCSLAAVVLIVFGVAYYIQSRSRFIVEVADFDFGQNNADMEYKTFTERLRDSFNKAVRMRSDRTSVRPPYYGSMNYQRIPEHQ